MLCKDDGSISVFFFWRQNAPNHFCFGCFCRSELFLRAETKTHFLRLTSFCIIHVCQDYLTGPTETLCQAKLRNPTSYTFLGKRCGGAFFGLPHLLTHSSSKIFTLHDNRAAFATLLRLSTHHPFADRADRCTCGRLFWFVP